MATPSSKAETIESVLFDICGFDRRKYIATDRCVPAPIGCGGPATEFRDEISRREYRISGLCQACQDSFFGN